VEHLAVGVLGGFEGEAGRAAREEKQVPKHK
jgi:hypothetical protein